ncbi:amphi-Trp domain-containing protein [Fundidesulfovibrio butyratiphilus]
MDKKDPKGQQTAHEGKFTHESVQDAASLAGYLEALAKGFSNEEMRFSRDDLEMILHPKGLINFMLEAKSKQGRMKLSLKFSWRERPEHEEKQKGPLRIEAGDGEKK